MTGQCFGLMTALLPGITGGKPDTETLTPNADGSTFEWGRINCVNEYQCVEFASDGEYLRTRGTGDIFTINVEDITDIDIITKVTVRALVKSDDPVEDRSVSFRVRPDAITYGLGTFIATTSYVWYEHVMTVSPETSSAWTVSEVNGTEFGLSNADFDATYYVDADQVAVVVSGWISPAHPIDDPNLVAYWSFEDTALNTDSAGGNDTTSNGTPVADTGNFKELLASVDLDSGDYLSVNDAGQDADMPGKSGGTISIASWFYVDAAGTSYPVAAKGAFNAQAWNLVKTGGEVLRFRLGISGGAAWEDFSHASTLSATTWYFGAITFDDSTKEWFVRVRDADCNLPSGFSDATGTATNNMNIEAGDIRIGNSEADSTQFIGNIDGLAVFKDILTEEESDNICRNGIQ